MTEWDPEPAAEVLTIPEAARVLVQVLALVLAEAYAEQFAYLLGKLTAVKEGNGTMLDNTVVLWVSEFSDSNGHASNKLLWFVAGNAGGALKQGRVIDCTGRGTNDLLTALANTFGVPGTHGNPAYGSGPLTAIYG